MLTDGADCGPPRPSVVDLQLVVRGEPAHAEDLQEALTHAVEHLFQSLELRRPRVSLDARPADGGLVIRLSASDAERGQGLDSRAAGARFTPRQQEVLRLLDRGLLSKQIAAELGVSLHTVNNHIHAIFKRLGAVSRTDALYRARRLALL